MLLLVTAALSGCLAQVFVPQTTTVPAEKSYSDVSVTFTPTAATKPVDDTNGTTSTGSQPVQTPGAPKSICEIGEPSDHVHFMVISACPFVSLRM
jgi:hypothetical protein